METIVPLIIQAVSGVVGSYFVGGVAKNSALGNLPKLLAGALGGVGGAGVLGSLISGALSGSPTGAMDLTSIMADVGGGVIGGGALSAVVGIVMGAMKK